jgi:hypothetical protein
MTSRPISDLVKGFSKQRLEEIEHEFNNLKGKIENEKLQQTLAPSIIPQQQKPEFQPSK